jgi:predicted acetyltransferase
VLDLDVRPVGSAEWPVLGWLWQCFRHDLALVVGGLPYPDGRYQTRGLPVARDPDVAAYLAWAPHPRTGERSPVGFAVVDGLTGPRRSIAALWVAPVVRSSGVGRLMALDALRRHDGPWTVAFQHDNAPAGRFWRRFADEAFGPEGWREEQREVPGVPHAPADHWIDSVA